MSAKKKIAVVVLLCAAASVGWAAFKFFHEKEELPKTAWGNVDTRQVDLTFEISGRISELNVEEGQRVHAGQLLGRLDVEALKLDAKRIEAELRQAQSSCALAEEGYRSEDIRTQRETVAALEARKKLSQISCKRQQELIRSKATTEQNRDEACFELSRIDHELKAQTEVLKKYEIGLRPEEIRQQQAKRDAARAELERIRYDIETASILTSPIEGVIRSRLAEPGDMSSPSRTIFQLSVTDPKWVRVFITERQFGFVHEGAGATVISDTAEPISATVGYISSTAEFTPKTVQTEDLRTALVYEVRLTVADPENVLRLGQPVTVQFE